MLKGFFLREGEKNHKKYFQTFFCRVPFFFAATYTNMIISMNKNYENLINNLKNRIIEEKFTFSIDYLNKKLPDEIIFKISTYL